jgi:hypothetical protein
MQKELARKQNAIASASTITHSNLAMRSNTWGRAVSKEDFMCDFVTRLGKSSPPVRRGGFPFLLIY